MVSVPCSRFSGDPGSDLDVKSMLASTMREIGERKRMTLVNTTLMIILCESLNSNFFLEKGFLYSVGVCVCVCVCGALIKTTSVCINSFGISIP